MTTIYLVRHAKNDLVGNRLAGWMPGVHLNEEGRAQANSLSGFFQKVPLNAVYSSPLERAVETAQPIAKVHGLDLVPRPDLGELRYGTWEGKTLKALRRRRLWPIILNTPSLARFPEGESFSEAQFRVVRELEAIRSLHKGRKATIACVSHGDIIKLAVAHYLGLALDHFQRLTIAPASITQLLIHEGSVRLLRLNHTLAGDSSKLE